MPRPKRTGDPQRPVTILLTDKEVAALRKLGGGFVAAGIRAALKRCNVKT